MSPAIETIPPFDASNSEISTFLRCRRKWWLAYLRGLRPRATSASVLGPLALGSRIHKVLEGYYMRGDALETTHARLLDEARDFLAADDYSLAKLDAEGELGRVMLEGYQEWVDAEGLDADIKVIGVEEILRYEILPGKMFLIGKIDMRVHRLRDDTRAVLDFKTSANFNDVLATAHMSPQLPTYMVLDQMNAEPDTRLDGGIYRMLRKVKRGPRAIPPFYQEFEIRHNVFFLRSFWYRLRGVLNNMYEARIALQAGEDHRTWAYPNVTRDCSWSCPFLKICPMFDDGSGVEDAIRDEFVTGNPYDYYEAEKETE